MDYVGQEVDIELLEQAIDGEEEGHARAQTHVRLAWYLRQRDTQRARKHAGMARMALDRKPALHPAIDESLYARLLLIEAEARWLFCETGAEEAAVNAFNRFAVCKDRMGQGDALMLRAHIHYDNPDPLVRAGLWRQAREAYVASEDVNRAGLVSAWQAYDATYLDARAIDQAHAELAHLHLAPHPCVRAISTWALAGIQFEKSDVSGSIRRYRASLELMEQCGQVRSAITVMHNIGAAFDTLHDYAAALTWFERATARARQTGWPRSEGTCLMGVGNVLRLMGRHEAALEFLRQAESRMERVPRGRLQATLQRSLGDTYVALRKPGKALHCFKRAETLVRGLDSDSLLSQTLRGKALALSENGQPEEAFEAASEGLRIAQALGDRAREIEIICALAGMARRHAWPAPRRSRAVNAAVYYTQRAVRLGSRLEGHIIPAEVFVDLSRDHERAGDLAAALRAERQGVAARELSYTRDAAQSAIAVEIRLEADTARADALRQRDLAQAEAARVAELNAANDLLARIGQMGQSITRSLSIGALLRVLQDCTRDLLPAGLVSVWLLHDSNVIEELAAPDPSESPERRRFKLDADVPLAACVRDLRARSLERASVFAGSSGSVLLAPLWNGHAVRGALVIEIDADGVYGEREMHVAASLANYVTIALANALAHEELDRSARTDKLTSIANRRCFDATLAAEISRARRSLRPLSLILIDVDQFKLFNDTYGHVKGDDCLRLIAARLASVSRDHCDLAARYGGEEFALVLPDTDSQAALSIADRLRMEIEALKLPHSASTVSTWVTVSSGVHTVLDSREVNAEDLIVAADKALYQAKQGGRNRCCSDSN